VAFGLVAVALGALDRAGLRRLGTRDWLAATWLTLAGNIIYFTLLVAAIQHAGGPLPTVIIGLLPLTMPIVANLAARELSWRALAPSLVVIALGLAFVNAAELAALGASAERSRYLLGALLALAALASWTVYGVMNARWLKARPYLASEAWASAQGLATLPIAIIGYALVCGYYAAFAPERFAVPWGARPWLFLVLSVAMGLLSSWLATLAWNKASSLLPTSLAGQLIVFETLAGLAYVFVYRGEWPGGVLAAGVALLVAGVVIGVRAFTVADAAVRPT
jgi:drug/metabolite transporter (DMT)-like permease